MRMKTIFALIGMACIPVISACLAQSPVTSAMIKSSFESAAPDLSTQHPWDSNALSSDQEMSLKQIEKLASKVMDQTGFASSMIKLLNDYKDQDGYQRQKLMQAVFNYPNYTLSDLPFLKSVFVASLTFHYDTYPTRVRGWYTPFAIRTHLANMILALNEGKPVDNPEVELLSANPASWLAKYAP